MHVLLYYIYMRKLLSVLGVRKSNWILKPASRVFDMKKVKVLDSRFSTRKQFELMARFGQLSGVVTRSTF